MDFEGQKLAETLCMYLVIGFAVISFLVGYLRQDFSTMMTIFGTGVAAAFVATVPDWPVYNKHPVKWLPPKEQPKRGGSKAGGSSGGGSGALRKKKQASWSNLWGVF